MNHASYSQFNTWAACPFQWKLRYIDKYRFPSVSIHLLFGTAINDTVQEYLMTYYEKTEKTANALDLNEILLSIMIREFEKYELEQPGFTTKKDLMSFYKDGVKILEWFKKRRSDYFSKRGYELLGCELALNYSIRENVKFVGRIDCAIKHINTGSVLIIDFKKSMRGWYDKEKKNPYKRGQLQLYKEFYSKQYGVDFEKISIEFLIFKQKINENSEYPSKRIQRYSPPSGTRSVGKIVKEFNDFVDTVFMPDGSYNIDCTYEHKPSKYNCNYCPFKDKKELCPVGVER